MPHCLAGCPPGFRPLLLAAHSRPVGFRLGARGVAPAPESRSSFPGTTRPSQVSRELRSTGHVASELPRTSTPYVRVSPRHSRRARRAFSPSRTQKLSGNRSVWTVRCPAPSPVGLTGKRLCVRASRGLAIPGRGLFPRSPNLWVILVRSLALAGKGSPHASYVERAAVLRGSPEPRRRDLHPLCSTTTATTLRSGGGVSLSPPLVGGITPSDRTPGLFPLLRAGV